MRFSTLIISKQAHQITEMLPGASRWGYICFHASNDLPAAQTAVGLVRAKAVILTPCHTALALAILNAMVASCFFYMQDRGLVASKVQLNRARNYPTELNSKLDNCFQRGVCDKSIESRLK